MKKLDHKVVCWGDYAIPVDLKHHWIAWESNGDVWASENEPYISESGNSFRSDGWMTEQIIMAEGLQIPPPEPGPWNKQVYWIG